MQLRNCVVAVFSPTGTTAKVAEAVAQGTGLAVQTVDLCRQPAEQTLAADTLLIAAMPVYGGRIPAVAKQRLQCLHGSGPAVAVVVYGNRAFEDALLETGDALAENGFTTVAAGAFIAEHNMVRTIATGRPDAQDLQTAKQLGAAAVQKLTAADVLPAAVAVPGDAAYREKKPGSGVPPKAGSACVGCGTCAAACPVGAIPLQDPAATGPECIGCMRCVAVCPQHARDLPAPVKLAVTGMLTVACAKPKQPELFL